MDAARQQLGQLESDRFCDGCGYNLHGQQVWRDERLGIPVCRCPECGRHHAVQQGTTAAVLWLKRLTSVFVIGWVMLLTFVIAGFFFAVYGITIGATENYQIRNLHLLIHGSQSLSVSDRFDVFDLVIPRFFQQMFGLAIVVIVCLAGWHRRRWQLLPAIVVPVIAITLGNTTARLSLSGSGFAGYQQTAMLAGVMDVTIAVVLGVTAVFTSRAVLRFLVKLFVPPKARVAVAELFETQSPAGRE